MKRSLLIIASILLLSPINAQKGIDALFTRYSGKDGFVALTISGNLFNLASCFDSDNEKKCSMAANVTEIRILAPEDQSNSPVNFYDMVMNGIDLHEYEEFMRVKESDQDLVMFVRSEGRTFHELLFIAGGDDNALIQIKGKITFAEAKKFSKDLKKNNGLNIDVDAK